LIINYQLSASVIGDQSCNPLGHCEEGAERGLSVRVRRASDSPRACSPRDLKHGTVTMKGVKRLELLFCHCEKHSIDHAAIHRVLGDAGGVVCSFIEGQWIATGFQP